MAHPALQAVDAVALYDLEEIDARVQKLLFDDLLPAWTSIDVALQLGRVGHFMRWQCVARSRGSLRVFNPREEDDAVQIVGRSYLWPVSL